MDKDLLYRYFAGKATEAEQEEIGRWLAEDKDAFKEYERTQFVFEGTILYAQAPKAEKGREPRGRLISRSFVSWAAAAVIALVLFLAGGLVVKQNAVRNLTAKMVTVTTKPGERASFTLPDGSVIRLNSDTKLTYPAVFAGKERNVYIEGEAMFEVARDERHPFIVSTFASKVKVLGTEFSVRAEKLESIFTVYLKKGKVSISLNGSSESIIMNPEDIVSLKDGVLSKTVQDDKSALCWLEGLVDLKCESFAALMDRLSKAYGVEIIVNGEGPSVDGLSGEIRISEGIEHALRSLQHVVSFSYSHEPGSERIIINP